MVFSFIHCEYHKELVLAIVIKHCFKSRLSFGSKYCFGFLPELLEHSPYGTLNLLITITWSLRELTKISLKEHSLHLWNTPTKPRCDIAILSEGFYSKLGFAEEEEKHGGNNGRMAMVLMTMEYGEDENKNWKYENWKLAIWDENKNIWKLTMKSDSTARCCKMRETMLDCSVKCKLNDNTK